MVISVFAIVILSIIGALFSVRILPPGLWKITLDSLAYRIVYLPISGSGLICHSQKKSHTLVGSTEDVDPEDAPKVAAAVFGAVGVYAVR